MACLAAAVVNPNRPGCQSGQGVLAAAGVTFVLLAALNREARKRGYAGNFYNVSFVGTQALLDELGTDAKGVVVSQVMPFPYSPATPISGEYLAALKDHPQIQIHTYAGRDHAFAREGGAHYDAADAAKANGRSLTFFQKALS